MSEQRKLKIEVTVTEYSSVEEFFGLKSHEDFLRELIEDETDLEVEEISVTEVK